MGRDILRSARRRGSKRMEKLLSDAYGPYLGLTGVPKQYQHRHPNEISKALFGRKLIMVRRKKNSREIGQYLIPLWQLADDVAPHMEKILDELKKFGSWTQLIFFLNGNTRLDGKTPLEALAEGKVEKVLTAAQTHHVHGAA